MKKFIKKLTLTFLTLLNLLYTTVYGNMTIEAMEESEKFYNEHKFLMDSTTIIARLISLISMIFIIIIPIIIIYKKIKLKNNENGRDKYIIKTLGLAELLCIINTFIIKFAFSLYGSERVFIFIIFISLLNVGIVLFKLLKKQKNWTLGVKKFRKIIR